METSATSKDLAAQTSQTKVVQMTDQPKLCIDCKHYIVNQQKQPCKECLLKQGIFWVKKV